MGKRILSLLLAAALLAAPLPARAEDPSVSGTISATVRVDWPQKLSVLQARDLKVTLSKDGQAIGTLPLTSESSASVGGYPASVALRGSDGSELGGGDWPGYLDVTVSGLPRGSYSLEFSGDGYVTSRQSLQLQDCSQHVTLGTGDATLTLGDLNGDGKVDSQDRDLVSNALGSAKSQDTQRFDLNGDGKIDVTDLAYISRNMKASGGGQIQNTGILSPAVSLTALQAGLNNSKLTFEGNLADLFQRNDKTVTFTGIPDSGADITIPFSTPEQMEEIQILSPEGDGALVAGSVTVTGEDGSIQNIPFDLTPPEGVHAIGPMPGFSVVTISLGRRVAVKEITISVTKTQSGDYAAIESIQFLREIVPENPAQPNVQVRNLTAVPGKGQVELRWTELPNVSGYRVDYRLRDGGESRSLQVTGTQAQVTGLEIKTYRFTVTPIDGSWEGKASDAVFASPLLTSAPAAPDMVSVNPLDSALQVSWKASETASYYEVYYQAEGEDGFQQWGGQLGNTQTVITGLTNGTTYLIYIVAGNAIGASGRSRTAAGIPAGADYSRPAGIPTEGVIDYNDIEQVWLAASYNYSPTAYSASAPFQPENMADGDFRTHWTSHSYGDGNWWNNKQVLCTFKTPQDLASVIWVPRLDGSYASNLRLYTITVWRDGEDLNGPGTLLVPDPEQGGSSDAKTWYPVGNNPAATRFAVLPMEPVTNVKKIAVTIEQVGYSAVSLSELMFLRYDPDRCLPDNIAGLFAGSLRTSLRPDVTQADIDALRQRLNSDEANYYLNLTAMDDELTLAEELLQGRITGSVLRGIQSRNSSADSAKYSQGGSVLQPLGSAAMAGEEITIYASGIPDGQTVTVTASQFNAEASAWQAQAGTLRNGRNILTIPKIGSQDTPRGGSLYLTYSGPNPEGISLHVRRAVTIPTLELSDWYSLTESQRQERIGAYVDALAAYVPAQDITDSNRTTNCLNVTEISTPTMLLSLPAAAVLSAVGPAGSDRADTLYQNVLAWEDVMHLCKTTQGIDNTYAGNDMQSRQNIRCMQMFTGAFMYAAGSHIGIGYGSCGGMVCGRPLSHSRPSLFGWGIAHEIGHNMDKLGKAEITNNIYSLVVQTADTGSFSKNSRLEASGKYPAIFTKTAQGYPGDSNDVFVQLGLYWQLHLAYDSGTDPIGFYNRFFKAWKAGTYFNGAAAYGDRLALTAAGVANRNLTEFFTRWGVTLSDSTRTALAGYPSEERAIWYLSDASRRERLNGTSPASGSLTVSAGLTKENEITLTITPSISGTLQGYEIRRSSDGGRTFQSIAFTTETSYTDIIGSANNRTYTYQAVAYDILGNAVNQEAAASNEVRVSYDKTVDPSAYTIRREGTSVTFTLTEETPVSGLKVLNPPAEGAFSITVSGSAEGLREPVTARSGSFSAGNQGTNGYLTYFQKPGAAAEDTRIWTYDAKTVTVTGIPESISDGDLQLISYAGDDIAFLEAGSVGVLAEAYTYGSGAGQTIPAGTLIITGSYRGDPIWQTVRIEGKFIDTTLTSSDEPVTNEYIRTMAGKALLFAEIPDDGEVSDISDGLFIFIPDVQQEAALQGEESHCAPTNLLPAQIRAVLSRTDEADSAESQRVTAETLWINSPGGSDLPAIILN